MLAGLVLFACSSSPDDAPAALDAGSASSSSGTSGTSGSSGTSGTSGSSGTSGADAGVDAAEAGADAGGARDLSTNRTAFFGASRCAGAGLQLCEDFESGTLDTTTWKVTGTAPTIDGVQKARGAKALHIKMNANGASYVKETKTFPATNNTYWARAFVYFASLPAPPAMTYSHWTFAAATGTGVQGEIRLSGQLQNGANHFGVGTDSGSSATGTGDWTNSDKDPTNAVRAVPTKEWMCIEWMHDGEHDETKFFWDAVEHPSLATTAAKHGGNTNPYVLPEFNALWFGWQEYQTSSGPFEMWVDEIAVDPKRIGCVL
ncbi:MAG: hypothetical protein JWP97_6654 [Labilithrix sp.]|nr:hypothetical protein [Labilithrix sp.]